MDNIKNTAVTVKNAVVRNKTRILGTALVITTGIAALQNAGLKQHDEFLKANGLYDEFYFPENDEN